MYRPDQFLTYSKNYLKQQINQKSIQEIRDFQKQDEENNQLTYSLHLKIDKIESELKEIVDREKLTNNNLNSMRRDLAEAESLAEHYQILDMDEGYQHMMLEVDELQTRCFELEEILNRLNIQEDSLKNELSHNKNLLNKLRNENAHKNYPNK
jgi:hypothetical protein